MDALEGWGGCCDVARGMSGRVRLSGLVELGRLPRKSRPDGKRST